MLTINGVGPDEAHFVLEDDDGASQSWTCVLKSNEPLILAIGEGFTAGEAEDDAFLSFARQAKSHHSRSA